MPQATFYIITLALSTHMVDLICCFRVVLPRCGSWCDYKYLPLMKRLVILFASLNAAGGNQAPVDPLRGDQARPGKTG